MSAGCSKCATRWTGLKAAHCTLCHETFTTVGNFDRHRRGPKGSSQAVDCHPPESVGLDPDHRGFWKMPGDTYEWSPIARKTVP